jgi:hypothetical protein
MFFSTENIALISKDVDDKLLRRFGDISGTQYFFFLLIPDD